MASFGHPYRKKEPFGDTLGPQNRQGGPLGTILSAQGPHNEICGVLFGAKGALCHPSGKPEASKWNPFGTTFGVLRGPMVAIKNTPEENLCFLFDFVSF